MFVFKFNPYPNIRLHFTQLFRCYFNILSCSRKQNLLEVLVQNLMQPMNWILFVQNYNLMWLYYVRHSHTQSQRSGENVILAIKFTYFLVIFGFVVQASLYSLFWHSVILRSHLELHNFNVCHYTIQLEPVGSVSPRLTSGDKIRTVDTNLGQSFTMLCPAQSYPVPSSRWDTFNRCT